MWYIWTEDPTCFKSSNPSCNDNFYTNKKTTFFNSSTAETSISDHRSLICTMLRSRICKSPTKFIPYSSFNSYNKEQFEIILKQRLVSSCNFYEFLNTFLATLNKYAPLKTKKIRYNHQIFMSKILRTWNNLSYEIYSARKLLLITGKFISVSVILRISPYSIRIRENADQNNWIRTLFTQLSVRVYWSQLKKLSLEI